jgi:polyphosphate kinase 2 (PPK2 family)
MHISHEEQGIQLQQRLDDKSKFWKHNAGDWEERKLWNQYMEAYEYAINNSSIPWHICPVDNRWFRDYFIAKTLVDALEKLDMRLPEPEKEA